MSHGIHRENVMKMRSIFSLMMLLASGAVAGAHARPETKAIDFAAISPESAAWTGAENGAEAPTPDPQTNETEKIKELLRSSGFSDAEIETLLNLFELRIKRESPTETAAEEMRKAGFSNAQAEALAKIFRMKKVTLGAAAQNALKRGISQERIDIVIKTGRMMKWPDDKIIEEMDKLVPREAPKEETKDGVRAISPQVQAAMREMAERTGLPEFFAGQIVEQLMKGGASDEQIVEVLKEFKMQKPGLPEKPENEKTDLDRAMEDAVKRGNSPLLVQWFVGQLRKQGFSDEEIIKKLAQLNLGGQKE